MLRKKIATIVVTLLLTQASGFAQEQSQKPKKELIPLVKKGTVNVFAGFGINGQGQTPGNQISMDCVLSPKMTFFIFNRWGIGAGYLGTYSSSNIGMIRREFSNNAELELLFAAVLTRRYYMGVQAGVTVGEHRVVMDKVMPPLTGKIGVSFNWQSREFPNFAFVLNPAAYVAQQPIGGTTLVYGCIHLGLSYSFFPKPN